MKMNGKCYETNSTEIERSEKVESTRKDSRQSFAINHSPNVASLLASAR